MENFNIGSLQLLGPTATNNYILQIPIEGLDAPDYRVTSYDNPGEDGGRVSQAFYSSRTITLVGAVMGQNPTLYEQNRAALSQACHINRDSNGYPVLTRLSWTTLAGASYFVDVQMQKPTMPMKNVVYTDFQVIALAPDHRIYGPGQVSSGPITRLISGGIIVPTIVPVLAGGSSGGFYSAINVGDTYSHPILTFTGPLTNPYIQNATTGYAFQLDLTIPGGSSVVVNMRNKTVVYNGSTNFRQYVDNLSSWWTVAPGENVFSFSTGNSGDTGNVQVKFYPAYEGV